VVVVVLVVVVVVVVASDVFVLNRWLFLPFSLARQLW
jgi:hypothetical protein